MGPDRHLVCWEISLGRSERLPSPLPAPAHQMWGEGRLLPGLFVFAVGPAAPSSPTLTTLPSRWKPHAFLIHSTRIFACRHACFVGVFFFAKKPTPRTPSPLLVSSIPVIVEHDSPQVGGHQLLLLVGKAEAGQMQLAGAAFRQAEVPVWDEGLLELVPVLQAARYLGGRARSLQCYECNAGIMDRNALCFARCCSLHPRGSSNQQCTLQTI